MELTEVIGHIPYRMALAGGWIDQPFVSALNPTPPGSMVVVSLQPVVRYMERCGMATGTRNVALARWGESLPAREPAEGSLLGDAVEGDTDCLAAADLEKVRRDEYRTTPATVNCRKYP